MNDKFPYGAYAEYYLIRGLDALFLVLVAVAAVLAPWECWRALRAAPGLGTGTWLAVAALYDVWVVWVLVRRIQKARQS